MALVLADRVKESTTTTGTTDFVLSGADTGFQTFAAGVGANNTTYYAVALAADFEIGLGTLSSDGLTLARTTVLQSSNSDNKVSFAAGSKYVFVTYPADKAVLTDATQTLTNKTLNSPTFVTPVLGTPSSGTLTNCTFPTLNQNTTGTASNVTGTVAIANGGTGATTRQDAMDALAGSTTSGQYLRGNGTDVVMAAIQAGDVPTLNQNTTGTASNVTGTVAVANGGTGQTSYTDGQLLIGNSTGNTLTKATLTAGTNITITNAAGAITIAASGGGASAATPTALGTVYGSQTTSGGSPYLTAYGYNAGVTNTTGQSNTFVGRNAGTTNNGNYNSFIGDGAGYSNTSGGSNTAVGTIALFTNTTASFSTAVGYEAAYSLSGSNGYTTAIGYQALATQSTGYSNTAVGYQSGYLMTTGIQNSMVGIESLRSNTTGNYNSAFGTYALNANTTASNNTAVGYQALYSSNTASNTAVGYQAASALTTGVANTVFGKNTGGSLTSGSYNVFLGHEAGYYINAVTTGSLNVAIGYGVGLAAATDDYEIVISTPYGSVGKGSYTAFINANTGGTYNGANTTTWATTSDQRLKKNIVNNNVGLEKLTQIQVRNFEYRVEDEITELPKNQAIKKTGLQLGVIAQELQQILPDCVKTESTGVMSVQSDNLTWYMINAIKELKAEFDAYKLTHP